MLYVRPSELLLPTASCALRPASSRPTPRLLEAIVLVSVSVKSFYFYFSIPHISDKMQYVSFSIWLILLRIVPSSFVHIVPSGRIFFLQWRIMFHFLSTTISRSIAAGGRSRCLSWLMLQWTREGRGRLEITGGIFWGMFPAAGGWVSRPFHFHLFEEASRCVP